MLKASLEYVQSDVAQSFLLRKFGTEAFSAPYHFHPEYELTFITHGKGKRYVGSHMDHFSAGDLVLIGPNLPHCWKLDDTVSTASEAGAIVVQFSMDMLGKGLLEKSELAEINALLQRACFGVRFGKEVAEKSGKSLQTLSDKNGFFALFGFLEILHRLAIDETYDALNQNAGVAMGTMADQQRIAPVFAYLVEHFKDKVSLDEAASLVNMTPHAFCKYFKKVTRKTFMEMVIEYRLKHATQQLIQTNKPVSEVSFDSGFADASFFYRTFKKRMKLSPLNYRYQFMRHA